METFAAFRPDPEAQVIDSFTISWSDLKFYAFPPFICVSKVIQKIIIDGASGILVVPDWPYQVWFNVYKSIVIDEVLLPPRIDLLGLPTNPDLIHPISSSLSLRVGLVSGTALHQRKYHHR